MTNVEQIAITPLSESPIKDYSPQTEWWLSKLNNLTDLQLPTDYPRPLPLKIIEAERTFELDDTQCLQLLQLSLQQSTPTAQITPFTIVLAAFSILLNKYTREEDLVVGTSSLQCNQMILRLNIQNEYSFKQVVSMVKREEDEAELHDIPYDYLIKALPDTSKSVLNKVRFFNQADTTVQMYSPGSTSELSIFISQKPTARRLLPIDVRIVYNTILFSDSRILEIQRQLLQLLQIVTKNPDIKVSEISLLTEYSKQVLPDPTRVVDWDKDWPGPITEIFMRNAQMNPNSLCVYDSNIKYTYKQIDDASTLLAKYLISTCGVAVEDVVVIYAYRGVDLVVSIMGVLKAGATFSVIDPQYPTQRQKIYLKVAKPKALITLKKACELSDEIREYLKQGQDLGVETMMIELLELSLCGELYYENNKLLVIDNDVELPKIMADNIGTLSFTSGSTGEPKGVRGRHYSLTQFYPWMSKQFQLTSKDRFTMLSGIAHDPIQRDIFTPLYLQAEIYIPRNNDIIEPGRLAQWLNEHKCTVTHLTPAMGQLLTANAQVKIPELKRAFFVGDLLTKRDVLRLQSLAENVQVINMYGTTETQRAVSYYLIKSSKQLQNEKQVLPAGCGMHGVELILVNSELKQCGIGEMGEIYVRSFGLAKEYLRKPEESKKKFIQNFFNPSNARDVMYRTGDLGRYRCDGVVECCGRADDQVKIRGFRIELGEIDMHLSQHEHVRENVTLVKRDAYEEKQLVSYIVPLDQSIDLQQLIKSIREYLKQKLANYMIPSLIVPLSKLPLTPNGKIDKNSLPYPDTLNIINTNDNITEMENKLIKIWQKVLGINNLSVDDNFFDVGGHSIVATQLIFQLRQELNYSDLPLNILFQHPTIKQMSLELERFQNFGILTRESKEGGGGEDDLDLEKYLVLDETIQPKPNQQLPDGFSSSNNNFQPKSIFLTGATGFLGAFILHHLHLKYPECIVYCLVRAKSIQEGFERLEKNMSQYLLQLNRQRTKVILGDLSLKQLGINDEIFSQLSDQIELIIHNGALVHWVYPLDKLFQANVQGTIEVLRLSVSGKYLKPFVFVSSTSVLDSPHYTQQSSHVLESDDLQGSRRGLKSGYGQSKWISERLLMMYRKSNNNKINIPIIIIRPGYILGDSMTGCCQTDDFIWRLVKGCIQLGQVPNILNIVNACSVDFVSKSILQIISLGKSSAQKCVFHIWNQRQQVRFLDLFQSLQHFGYGNPSSPSSSSTIEYPGLRELHVTQYLQWRDGLMDLTLKGNDNALFPLLHFVLDDLPTSTKSPQLDCRNLQWALDQSDIVHPYLVRHGDNSVCLMDKYLQYLCNIDFLPLPFGKQKSLDTTKFIVTGRNNK